MLFSIFILLIASRVIAGGYRCGRIEMKARGRWENCCTAALYDLDNPLPVIDFDEFEDTIVDEIDTAARETGIFYVENHKISDDVLSRAKNVLYEFFTLDEVVKETQDTYSNDEISEAVEIYVKVTDLLESNDLLTNDTYIIEQHLPGFQLATHDYFMSMYDLTMNVFGAVGTALGVPEKAFDRYMEEASFMIRYHKFKTPLVDEESDSIVQDEELSRMYLEEIMEESQQDGELTEINEIGEEHFINLPDVRIEFKGKDDQEEEEEQSEEQPKEKGCGAHTHTGSIAIYWQDNAGTQIFHPSEDESDICSGYWTPIGHIPETFVVVIGDSLEEFSFGEYTSPPHRQVIPENTRHVMELHVHAGCDCATLWEEQGHSSRVVPTLILFFVSLVIAIWS